MYRAFNLKNICFESSDKKDLLNRYNQSHKNTCKEIRKNIKDFILSDYDLDGSALQDAFFPTDLMPDVFISHSNADEDFAKAFAQYLYNTFNITSFIDSTVWGGFTELQNSLDSYFISTKGRNYTRDDQYRVISHVHLMLNTALMQMINRCEAFFLLNTPQSVSVDDIIGDSTYSPWIFSEIGMYHLIEKHKPKRCIQESMNFDSGRIKQRIDLTDFTVLTNSDLNSWAENYHKQRNGYFTHGVVALDVLYDMKSIEEN